MKFARPTAVIFALAIGLSVVIAGPASATSDLVGTSGIPSGGSTLSQLDYSDGATVIASVTGSVIVPGGTNTFCMRNEGTGNCNWGAAPSAVDFTGVYSDDAVKDTNGIPVKFTSNSAGTMCSIPTVSPGGALIPAQAAACNSGNSVGTVTFTFSRPITQATLHVGNLGGSGGYSWLPTTQAYDEWYGIWPTFTLTTAGVSMSQATSRGNIQLSGSAISVIQPVYSGTLPNPVLPGVSQHSDLGYVGGYPLPYAGYSSVLTSSNIQETGNPGANPVRPILLASNSATRYTTGSGSFTVTSTTPITSVTFDITYAAQMVATPYSGARLVDVAGPYVPDTTAFNWSIPAASGGGSSGGGTSPSLPGIEALDSSYTTPFNTPITVPASNGALANDTGYAISVAQSAQPANGTAVVNPNGSFTYTPNNGFFGTDCWPYVIGDPYGQSARAQLCVTVPKPTISAVDDYYSTPYETPIKGNAAPTDTYPSGSTFTTTGNPSHGSVTMKTDGSFTYTPDPKFSGTDSFPYKVCMPAPNQELCASAVEYITVPGPNDPLATPKLIVVRPGSVTPVPFDPFKFARASGGQVLERGETVICPLSAGKCGSKIVVPGKGTWTIRRGLVLFTPVKGFDGQSTIRYRVTDSSGKRATSTFTVITKSAPTSVHGGVA